MRNVETVAVPSFFMISSFLFYRNYTVAKTGTKLRSRFYSLVIPYLIWNAVAVVFEMLFCLFASDYMNYSANPFSITFGALACWQCILGNEEFPAEIYRCIDIVMNLLKSIAMWIAADLFIFRIPNMRIWSLSFIIYATHWNVKKIIMTIVRIACSKTISGFFLEELIVWIVSSSITLAFIIGFAMLCEKYTPKIYAVITGNRM